MTENSQETSARSYRIYLLFMIAACGGACLWQFLTPQIAELYSIWGTAVGWQREIALWNVAFIIAMLLSIKKNNAAVTLKWMKMEFIARKPDTQQKSEFLDLSKKNRLLDHPD